MSSTTTRPHAATLGYALFLVIYATQIWGGVFPFLPASFQTDQVTLAFYLSQSIAFCLAFVASLFGSFRWPAGARRMYVALPTVLIMCGAVSIIAAMYVPTLTMALVIAGGVALGVGCAGGFMLWQRYFSSIPADTCNLRLIAGTILASLGYFALYLIPIALTAFLVPVVLLPVCALCCTLSVREMDFAQPMFEDVPREHPKVYQRVIKDFWRSAVCVGALGFAAGLARGVAVIDPALSSVTNVASMAGALAAAVGLLALWLAASVRFSLRTVFRLAYPVLITGLLLFPFVQREGLNMFAGLTYAVFSLIVLVMMMHCAQIARERGTNPLFAYAFFGSAAYVPQALGFLLGWFVHDIQILGVGQATLLSLLAAYVLGMSLFIAGGAVMGTSSDGTPRRDDQIEMLSLMPRRHRRAGAGAAREAAATERAAASRMLAGKKAGEGEEGARGEGENSGVACVPAVETASIESATPDAQQAGVATKKHPLPSFRGAALRGAGDVGPTIRDRLSKQCLVLQREYRLSARETEVCELIARGLSMASIAEELFVSENTVRTHAKHIYTKLDIHSRQELGELVRATNIG